MHYRAILNVAGALVIGAGSGIGMSSNAYAQITAVPIDSDDIGGIVRGPMDQKQGSG